MPSTYALPAAKQADSPAVAGFSRKRDFPEDKVAMVGILDSLSKGGFIRRTRSRDDRRNHHIVLASKAQKAIPEIRRTIRDLNQLALAGMPRSFQAQVPAALLDMRTALEKVIREGGKRESPQPSARKSRSLNAD